MFCYVRVAERHERVGDDMARRIEHGRLQCYSYMELSSVSPSAAKVVALRTTMHLQQEHCSSTASTLRSRSFTSKAFSIPAAGGTTLVHVRIGQQQ